MLQIAEEYVKRHPEIELIKIDATTKENTDFLEATLKGEIAVPTALVNNLYIIKGDASFLQRLTYTLQLAENMPDTQEDTQKRLLKQ